MRQTSKTPYLLFESQIKKRSNSTKSYKNDMPRLPIVVLPILNLLFCNMLYFFNIRLSPALWRITFLRYMGYTQDVVGLNGTQRGVRKTHQIVKASLILLYMASGAWAAQVQPGAPIIEENHYAVPCIVRDTGNEVAALDFHLMYDPALFQPLAVEPGSAALQAGKMVTANMAEPGRYIVVMMGLNQTTIPDGVVAMVTLLRVGESPDGMTTLALAQPTLSTWEGKELAAQGGMVRVPVKRPDTSTEGEGEGGTKPPDGDTPGDGTISDPEVPTVTGPEPGGNNDVPARPSAPAKGGEGRDGAGLANMAGITGNLAALREEADVHRIDGPASGQTFEPDPKSGGSGAVKAENGNSPVGPASSLTIEQDTLGDVDKTFVISATSETPTVPGATGGDPPVSTRTKWWPVLLIAFFCVGAFWVLRFRLFR
ncbi:MAG: hypothetical protein H3C30_00350 [Candidatus Hydrogenedentes bacterium]|nr:hypothetical protein [Candidatus Hydrogenedentota bacterium]